MVAFQQYFRSMKMEPNILKYLNVSAYFSCIKSSFQEHLLNYNLAVIICDTNTYNYCYPILETNFTINFPKQIIVIEAGESFKNMETCQFIYSQLLNNNITKKTLLIALGGGVVCDITGFVGSTYKRGIDFLFFPTTYLAMVDAAIGGKNGINFLNQKNMIGCIRQPKAIFIESIFLNTLPVDEIRNGFAETLKHGLIYDKFFFEKLDFDTVKDIDNIQKSAQIKMNIVACDEHENNLRKCLNAGHTIAHALESHAMQYAGNVLGHGNAVALGLYCECYIALKKQLLSQENFNIISKKIQLIYPKYLFKKSDVDTIINYALNDKKNDHKIRLSLIVNIGEVKLDVICSELEISEALNFYLINYRL